MERLIAYDKLAREDRLVRMRAREVAQLKVDQGLPPFPDLLSRDSIKERVHGIMVGEMQAMEGAGRTVYDFPDTPWEFTMDMARQVWDESRHVEIYVRLLEHLDGYIGAFPGTTILWRGAGGRGQPRSRGPGLRRVQPARAHRAQDGRPDPGARGRLRAGRRDHPRADGLEVAHSAHRGRSRAPPPRGGGPGDHRRAVQPGRDPAGRRARCGADLHRDRGPPRGRAHRRGDRPADPDAPPLGRLLNP